MKEDMNYFNEMSDPRVGRAREALTRDSPVVASDVFRDLLAAYDELARGKAAEQVWESIARTYRRATIELTEEIMGMNADKELMNKVESFLTGAGPDPCERSSFYDHWCDVHNARMPEGDDTCDTYRLVESLAEELFCNG